MKNLTRRSAPLIGVVVLGALLLAAAASGRRNSPASGTRHQGVRLLPDTKSSTRYTLFDAPYLKQAFKKANVSAQVLNALERLAEAESQAQQCLARARR